MKQRLLINLLLLILASTMAVTAWMVPAPQPEAVPTLSHETPANIREITITRNNGQHSHFELRGQQWWMTSPYALPAHQHRMQLLTRVVEAPVLSEFPIPEKGLEQYGLDQPLRLQLNQWLFEFGNTNPISNHRYIRHDQRITLSVDRFHHHLDLPPEQLLALEPIPPGAQLKEIVTPHYRLNRSEKGWAIDPPDPSLSSDQLVHLAQLWHDLQALQVQLMQEPLPEPQVSVTLQDGSIKQFSVVYQGSSSWLVDPQLRLGYQLPSTELLHSPQADAADARATGG